MKCHSKCGNVRSLARKGTVHISCKSDGGDIHIYVGSVQALQKFFGNTELQFT
jgi:hypothetical protein